MRVCVVGAGGASGAAACRALSEAGHIVVPLDEAAEPGGVWKNLAPNFLADTSRSQMRLCGNSLGSRDKSKEYPLAQEVLGHVRKASSSSILFNHRVIVVERVSSGKWQVDGLHSETGANFSISVDAVVVATGACSVPYYPPFARACVAQLRKQRQVHNPAVEDMRQRRVRMQGMSILHSHDFPWNNAQEFAGQVRTG
jgi:cation diffusion facilitator CzcD-associated flavoprotein CzcO